MRLNSFLPELGSLYPDRDPTAALARYEKALGSFEKIFGAGEDPCFFSVPGRSELSGNHTDHNRGMVIAASVGLDIIAAARKRDDGIVRIKSEGFRENTVDLKKPLVPEEALFGSSDALVRGVCAGFGKNGFRTGGFEAYTTSEVLRGSGLSSSAAFENMTGTILNHLYNGGKIGYLTIAKISQYAENEFFGKPSGLMDQIACAAGGISAIDFADPLSPTVEKIDFDPAEAGYSLCIVNTGGSHAGLTEDYASIPREMRAAANFFGKDALRDVDENDFMNEITNVRKKAGDRAVLRALHFFAENARVRRQTEALKAGRFDEYLADAKRSGISSFCYLQNVCKDGEQGLALALCLTENFAEERGIAEKSAWRVHGGGFAGTIQSYIPAAYADEYRKYMDRVFGEGSCLLPSVRRKGAVKLF